MLMSGKGLPESYLPRNLREFMSIQQIWPSSVPRQALASRTQSAVTLAEISNWKKTLFSGVATGQVMICPRQVISTKQICLPSCTPSTAANPASKSTMLQTSVRENWVRSVFLRRSMNLLMKAMPTQTVASSGSQTTRMARMGSGGMSSRQVSRRAQLAANSSRRSSVDVDWQTSQLLELLTFCSLHPAKAGSDPTDSNITYHPHRPHPCHISRHPSPPPQTPAIKEELLL